MEGLWDFLDPWRAALCARLYTTQPRPPTYSLYVSLITPHQPDPSQRFSSTLEIAIGIPVDEASRRNFGELKSTREALELFTVLFKLNSNKFCELLAQTRPANASNCQLVWSLWPVGVLEYQNKASLTWGDLLGFTGDLWTNSPEFLSAMHKLERMGEKQAAGMSDAVSGLELSWACAFPASPIVGYQECGKEKDTLSLFPRQLREVMGFRVPLIARLCVIRIGKPVAESRIRHRLEDNAPSIGNASTATMPALCQCLVVKEVNLAETRDLTEMALVLALTPCEFFVLSFADIYDWEEDVELISSTLVVSAGLLLNVLLRGRALCPPTGHNLSFQPASTSVKKCELSSSWMSDGVFAAICSAVAELPPETAMDYLSFHAVCQNRWPWLVYMLCCGSPLLNVNELHLVGVSLTRTNITAIGEMMQNRYPVVAPETSTVRAPEYGFASISKGAELWLTGVNGGDNKVLILATALRCRARYFSTSTPNWVEVVVPGYGLCKTRVGDGTNRFDCDSLGFDTPTFRECRLQSLNLHISKIELDTLVLGLLHFVGGGLRFLSMQLDESDPNEVYDPNNRADLDLGKLAAVCPHLEVLELKYFDVVVLPSNDDALRDWPIKKVDIADSDKLPDLAPYLERPEMRMARELLEISISAQGNEDFDEETINNLEAHDGDCLPLVKKKFPVQSKIGMLSVVASSWSSCRPVLGAKAINKLDANVLSRIFAFAATPEKRKVCCKV